LSNDKFFKWKKLGYIWILCRKNRFFDFFILQFKGISFNTYNSGRLYPIDYELKERRWKTGGGRGWRSKERGRDSHGIFTLLFSFFIRPVLFTFYYFYYFYYFLSQLSPFHKRFRQFWTVSVIFKARKAQKGS
jgi:hypothetical protein